MDERRPSISTNGKSTSRRTSVSPTTSRSASANRARNSRSIPSRSSPLTGRARNALTCSTKRGLGLLARDGWRNGWVREILALGQPSGAMFWVGTAHCSRGPLPRLPSPSSTLLTNCHRCPLTLLSSKYTIPIISITYEVFLVSIRDLHPRRMIPALASHLLLLSLPTMIMAEDTLELTRFRGPLTFWGGGIHHAEIETAPRFHGGRLRRPSGAGGSSWFAPDGLRKSWLVNGGVVVCRRETVRTHRPGAPQLGRAGRA